MTDNAKHTRADVIPTLRYADAAAAIDWLCEAFGFQKHAVFEGEGGRIEHAQLVFGNGMIMLGSSRDDEYGRMMKTPREAGGFNTQSAYIIVADVAAHYARAAAAGAEIVMEIREEEFGSMYSCRDPEGNLWNFGDYDPWAPPPQEG
jgi:uncharacterized glyoxalase superfamily protein PhnB